MKLNLENNVSGWVLIEARLGRHRQYSFPSLSIRRRSDLSRTEEIVLPILRDGWIIELIELPDDVAELVCRLPENEQPRDPGFTLRRVGWIERNLRMVNRVLWTYGDLSRDRRRQLGLSLPRSVVFNRPLAYRLANEYGPKLQERPYPAWSARFNVPSDRDRGKIVAHVARLTTRPRFHVLIATDDSGPDAVRTTLTSLQRQLYGDFTYTILDSTGAREGFLRADADWKQTGLGPHMVAEDGIDDWLTAFNASLSREKVADWVMLLRAGDALPEHSLYWFACEVLARPESAILYSDDDEVDSAGRPSHPRFKSDWSLAHLRSTHYIGDAVVLRGGAVAEAGGVTLDCLRHGNYDLLLRTIDAVGERVGHIPAVLLHRRGGGTRFKELGTPHGATRDTWEDPAWCVSKLTEHLERKGIEAAVVETLVKCRRVRYRLPETVPLISIIVPTRDALALLQQCVESVLEKSTYPSFELLVVDNQSTEPETLSYLGDLARRSAARVLRYGRPFNYSAINNFAAREAKGEILCLLNNDTEVISPDWLEEMVSHLLQPQVGAVGARLLYPDGRVQHGGVTVGPGGCADHLHAELPRGHPGYCQRAVIAQELSAVTAACMLTWKRLYEQLGGLNEHALPVAFNDVDYCLRLRDVGYRVIYTPHAELYHHESGSRGIDTTRRERRRARREIKYMRTRWREHMKHDPYYNPNLSYDQPNFTLNWKPRITKPWER